MPAWLPPPRIKIYEALGCIGDGRIEITGDEAKVYSSSRGKYYSIKYDPKTNAIMANDNGSYWKGYLGYPSIAFLMLRGVIRYNPSSAEALKGIAWKDVNVKYGNDFAKTEEYVKQLLSEKGINMNRFVEEIDYIHALIFNLKIEKLGKKTLPPSGY